MEIKLSLLSKVNLLALFVFLIVITLQHSSTSEKKLDLGLACEQVLINPLSDKHLISPYNIILDLHIKVTGIKKIITN